MQTCKLIIKDEVNIKLEGLSPEVRRKISTAMKYEIPYARHTPLYKLGRWDGTVTFFGIGGDGYLNHLEKIIPVLEKNKIEIGEIEDRRAPVKLDLGTIAETYWGEQGKTWPDGHRFAGQPITLRTDQVEVINKFLENPQCLQEIATGFGKCLAGDTIVKLETASGVRELPIGELSSMIEQIKSTKLVHNQEIDVSDLELSVSTPTGTVKIKHFVKKFNLPITKISLSNGYTFKAANQHILLTDNRNIQVKDLEVGTAIDHRSGTVKVVELVAAGTEDCYDIAIDYPHLYYDANGVVHHNTITTATLANVCEKYGKSIIIVPNTSLVEQTEEDFTNCGLDVGVYYGSRKDIGRTHTICTWQSLNSLQKASKENAEGVRLEDLVDGVSTIIVDECFAGDTLVATPDGKIMIKDIVPGNKVINFCEKTKTYKEDIVVKVHKNLTNSLTEHMMKLTFDDNTTVNVTANHKFLTDCGWVRADSITENMSIFNIVKNTKLTQKTIIEKPAEVYNLHIQTDHNYIANNIVVSNCHQAKADVLKAMLTQTFANIPIRWGLTGTIPKAEYEFLTLSASIGPLVNKVGAKELQDKGILSNCHVNVVQLIDIRRFKQYQEELKYLVTTRERMNFIATLCNKIKLSGNVLILVDRVEAGEQLAASIENSVFISGAVKSTVRKEHYDEVQDSNDKVIIATYGVAAVGINLPRIFNLVLIEPGKSFVRVIQSIGRGIRRANDKDFVQVWDIASTCKFAARHLSERKKFYAQAQYPYTVEKVTWET